MTVGTMGERVFRLLKRQMVYLGVPLVLSVILAGCNGTPRLTESGKRIPMKPCHLKAPGSDMRLPAECGSMAVYENYVDQSGRKIDLHIAMIPAISR